MAQPRVVMLTGAAGGIGTALAAEIVRRGDYLLATDIDLEVLRTCGCDNSTCATPRRGNRLCKKRSTRGERST